MQKNIIIILLMLLLNSCGSILTIAGISGPSAQFINGIEIAKNLYDLNQFANGEKTTTESFASSMTEQDCSINNLLNSKSLCIWDWSDVIIDKSTGIDYNLVEYN